MRPPSGAAPAGRDVNIPASVDVEQTMTSRAQPARASSRTKHNTPVAGRLPRSPVIASAASPAPTTADSRRRPFWRSTSSTHGDRSGPVLAVDDEHTTRTNGNVVDVRSRSARPPDVVEQDPALRSERLQASSRRGLPCRSPLPPVGRPDEALALLPLPPRVRPSRLPRHVHFLPICLSREGRTRILGSAAKRCLPASPCRPELPSRRRVSSARNMRVLTTDSPADVRPRGRTEQGS